MAAGSQPQRIIVVRALPHSTGLKQANGTVNRGRAYISRFGPIQAARFTSEAFARLERERMWPYAWQFACPFHGFTWNKEASFNSMPCEWDFSHLVRQKLDLLEAVGVMEGLPHSACLLIGARTSRGCFGP